MIKLKPNFHTLYVNLVNKNNFFVSKQRKGNCIFFDLGMKQISHEIGEQKVLLTRKDLRLASYLCEKLLN